MDNQLKQFSAMGSEENWRTQGFRQSVVSKIEQVIQQSGMQVARNSSEMENHVFLKAKTREEYMNMVAKLILHVREMSQPKQNQGGPNMQGPNQNQGGPNQQVSNQQGQPQSGPNSQQGMAPDPINALQNLASQGSRNQMMNMGPQGQMQQQMGPNPGMGGMQSQMGQQGPIVSQGQAQTATNLLQTLNQRPQLNMQLPNKLGGGMGMVPNQGQMGPMGGQMGGMNPMGSQLQSQLAGPMQSQMMPNMSMPNSMQVPMSGSNSMGGQMPCNQVGGMGQLGPNQMQGQMGPGPMGTVAGINLPRFYTTSHNFSNQYLYYVPDEKVEPIQTKSVNHNFSNETIHEGKRRDSNEEAINTKKYKIDAFSEGNNYKDNKKENVLDPAEDVEEYYMQESRIKIEPASPEPPASLQVEANITSSTSTLTTTNSEQLYEQFQQYFGCVLVDQLKRVRPEIRLRCYLDLMATIIKYTEDQNV